MHRARRRFSRAGYRTVGSSRPLERAGKIISAAFAPRREGRVAFRKKRAFPLLPASEIPTREDVDLPLRGYLPRATRTANADAGISEREEAERERSGSGCLATERGERKNERDGRARVCVCGDIRRCTRLRRAAREWKGERAKARERHRGRGRGVERERDMGREERPGQKERGSVTPTTGVKTTPRARGVSGLGAEANRARPKRAQCPTHTRSRTAHD